MLPPPAQKPLQSGQDFLGSGAPYASIGIRVSIVIVSRALSCMMSVWISSLLEVLCGTKGKIKRVRGRKREGGNEERWDCDSAVRL